MTVSSVGRPAFSAADFIRSGSQPGALNDLSVGLARHPDIVGFARQLVCGRADRLSRIATVFSFVGLLVETTVSWTTDPADGVDVLLRLAGEESGPAVIVSALLRALGEHAQIDSAAGMAFVRVEVELNDLARLPPYARPSVAHGRYYIPLDARRARTPLGFLPFTVRRVLQGRREARELVTRSALRRLRRQ
ncbi:MAG: hypothetical protein JXO72_10675 [Vicinamibacteria bacterium]|nr:hypothetical protein [Vicinamibacteria bacterium]